MTNTDDADHRFMQRALDAARESLDSEDVPVGAVVVHGGRIIGRGCNQREKLQDPTAHAEMLALSAAAAHIGHWRLEGCTLYVTLEPCLMCAGAILLARVPRLVYGATDPKAGACGSLFEVNNDSRLNHSIETVSGVLASDSAALLRAFFQQRRAAGEK